MATATTLPYCGAAPSPGELLSRFNLDSLLGVALILFAGLHAWHLRRRGLPLAAPMTGWALAAAALMSPLCALSVSLFSARVGQHMFLALVAAPLIASGLPHVRSVRSAGLAGGAFLLALWGWHMPMPYAATFRSDVVYWLMHATLFGSAIWLWRALLSLEAERALPILAIGAASSVQMGLLGAVFAMTNSALFTVHELTAPVWGLSPLADQQLGGLLMWVPGLFFFLLAAVRTVWPLLSPPRTARN